MPSTFTAAKAPAVKRFVPVKRNQTTKEIVQKINAEEELKNWKVKTNIIERIRKNDPDKPFYETVTPDMAMDLLSLNITENREVDWLLVHEYAEQMQKQKWKERNGDPLRYTKSMKLIDGQHKLWAIRLSGISISYLFVTGLDDDASLYIDLQRRRNAKDITSINGYKKNSGQLAQIVKLILLYESKSILRGAITDKHIANWEVNAFEAKKAVMKEISNDLEYAKSYWMEQNSKFLTPAQWVFVFYELRTLPNVAKKAKDFLDQFASGTDLKPNSPIHVIRQYFIKDFAHLKNRSVNKPNQVSITIKVKHIFEAWNAYIRNEKVQEIKVDLNDPIIPKPVWR